MQRNMCDICLHTSGPKFDSYRCNCSNRIQAQFFCGDSDNLLGQCGCQAAKWIKNCLELNVELGNSTWPQLPRDRQGVHSGQ